MEPGLERADDATILAAMRNFDLERPWKMARHHVVPMLPRARPYPVAINEPVRAMLPPGILVGFGIDIGPALTMIDRSQLERWAIDVDTLTAQALENVQRLAALCDPGLVIRDRTGPVPVAALQTRVGIAAVLLLVPSLLERFFGREPAFFLAPMRDLLLALPADVDRGEAAWLAEEWEALDPNSLHLGGFAWDVDRIIPEALDEAVASA